MKSHREFGHGIEDGGSSVSVVESLQNFQAETFFPGSIWTGSVALPRGTGGRGPSYCVKHVVM